MKLSPMLRAEQSLPSVAISCPWTLKKISPVKEIGMFKGALSGSKMFTLALQMFRSLARGYKQGMFKREHWLEYELIVPRVEDFV